MWWHHRLIKRRQPSGKPHGHSPAIDTQIIIIEQGKEVPEEDEERLLEATMFMDDMERKHIICPGKAGTGKSPEEISKAMKAANEAFKLEKNAQYGTYDSRFPKL